LAALSAIAGEVRQSAPQQVLLQAPLLATLASVADIASTEIVMGASSRLAAGKMTALAIEAFEAWQTFPEMARQGEGEAE
jgi:hypothetical protein